MLYLTPHMVSCLQNETAWIICNLTDVCVYVYYSNLFNIPLKVGCVCQSFDTFESDIFCMFGPVTALMASVAFIINSSPEPNLKGLSEKNVRRLSLFSPSLFTFHIFITSKKTWAKFNQTWHDSKGKQIIIMGRVGLQWKGLNFYIEIKGEKNLLKSCYLKLLLKQQ